MSTERKKQTNTSSLPLAATPVLRFPCIAGLVQQWCFFLNYIIIIIDTVFMSHFFAKKNYARYLQHCIHQPLHSHVASLPLLF